MKAYTTSLCVDSPMAIESPFKTFFICSMSIETIGEAWQLGSQVTARA
jgi:hypothetical protein